VVMETGWPNSGLVHRRRGAASAAAFVTLYASTRRRSSEASASLNFRSTAASTCETPEPRTAFRLRFPVVFGAGATNAAGFSLRPPGVFGSLIHIGAPSTGFGLGALTYASPHTVSCTRTSTWKPVHVLAIP